MESEVKIMTCKKCGHSIFMIALGDKVQTIVCSKPGCGEPQLNLSGSPEMFTRMNSRKVVSQQKVETVAEAPLKV